MAVPPWELGKGDDCLDPLRPQFLSSWGPSVYAYLLLPPPKKSEESCGRQNNVRPPLTAKDDDVIIPGTCERVGLCCVARGN